MLEVVFFLLSIKFRFKRYITWLCSDHFKNFENFRVGQGSHELARVGPAPWQDRKSCHGPFFGFYHVFIP